MVIQHLKRKKMNDHLSNRKGTRRSKNSTHLKSLPPRQTDRYGEEALRQSEERYRTLVEGSFDGIFIQEGQKIIFANRRLYEMLGYDPGELEGLDHWLVYHPDYQKLTRERAQARMRGEKVLSQYEVKLQRKNGSSFYGEINARKILIHSQPGIQVWVRDITERKQAEDALKQESSFRNTIIEHATEGLCVCHEIAEFPYVTFTVWNNRMTQITGYTMDEINRLGWYQTMYPDPEIQNQAIERMNRMRRGDDLLDEDWKITRADGEERVLSISTSVLQTGDGIIHVLALMHDATEHKHADEMVRQSEEKYRTILENIAEGYYEVDLAGNLTFFNDSVSQLLGYPKEELIGKNYREYMDQENAEKLYQTFNRVYRTGVPSKGFGWEIIRKDGMKRFIEASVSLIKNALGQPTGFRGIVQDKTEYKQAEEALRRSEENYRLVSENIPVAVYSALPDEHSTNLFISGRMEELTGYPSHQFIENPELWMKVIHPEDQEKVWREVQKHRKERKPLDVEYRLITRDNMTKWIRDKATPAMNEKGEIVRIDGFMEDITEQKQMEEALRESVERFKQVAETTGEWIWEVNPNGLYTYSSPAVGKILGYKIEEIVEKKHFYDLFPPDVREELKKAAFEVFARKEPFKNFLNPNVTKSGNIVFLETSGAPVLDPHGILLGYRGTDTDVTERKQSEEALRSEKRRFQTLSENAPFGMVMINQDGVFEYINPKFKELFGYDLEDIPDGKTWFRKAYPDSTYRHQVIEAWIHDLKNSIPGEKRARIFKAICKDGTEKIVNFISVQLERGEQLMACEDITDRMRAEEALRQSEERYRTILENIEDGYYEVDLPGNFTFFNDSLCRMLGYSRDEMIGMGNQQYTDEKNRKKLFEAFNEVYRAGKPQKSFDLEVIRKDGMKLFGEVSVSPIRDSNGQLVGFRGIARDITNRKRIEEALQKEKQKFQTLSEQAPFGMVMIDEDGTFHYINPKFRELFGYDLTDTPDGKTWFRKAYPDPTYRHQVIEAWINDLKNFKPGEKRSQIFTVRCKDKSEKTINFIPVQLETGETLMACEDITERRRAEEALKKSEERFQELFNDAPVGYFEYNAEGYITDVNQTELEMLGYSREEMIGQPVWKFVTDEEIVRHQVLGKLAGTIPPARGVERNYRRKDGTNFTGIIEDRLLKDSDGKIIGIRSTIQDITDRKRAEEEMMVLEEQLRQSQKMEAIGQLAGGVAHDFNNLLTVIKGYSQLSLLDLVESNPLWGNIQEIQKATQRAADLTRQLLAFSRRQILDLKVLNLNTLLRDLNKMLRRVIGEDIELVTLLTEDLGRVKIDPGQFEQMVLNLAVNARDAMPSGGKLTIETSNVELDEEYARTHVGVRTGSYVQFSISDTGVGIPLEIKEKVFEPFFTTKEKGRGTGLGLSTVYGIVKQSGGNIWVYSEPGHGTTFKIYFPRVEAELDSVPKQTETDSLPRGNETVLLVEDDPLVRDLARRLLNQQGYRVLEAGNGDEALRVANTYGDKNIDLLLTDVVMPQMGGKELVEKLKSLRPDIKVLYTSGYTDNAIVHHGTLEQDTYFLQKPFSPKTLSHKVREVLDR